MKFFIENGSNDWDGFREEVATFHKYGIVHGVTLHVLRACNDIQHFCCDIDIPCHVEIVGDDASKMVGQGTNFGKISDKVVINLPATLEGLCACHYLGNDGIKVNMRCCSSSQAILAARAGATYISLPIGRLENMGYDGVELLQDIRMVYDSYEDLSPYIVASSIRSLKHIELSSRCGADIASVPLNIFKTIMSHPRADQIMGACSVESSNGK